MMSPQFRVIRQIRSLFAIVAIVGLAILANTCFSGNRGASTAMQFNLQNYTTADEAKRAVSDALPMGVSRRAVEEWLEKSGIQCLPGNVRDPYIACRHIEPSGNMVHTVWSFGFFFTERRELERIEVNRGLVGP